MKNTRQKILEASKALFNAHSYFNVTIRMIAQAVGISSGNLNYHFKKREEILWALYSEMVTQFDERVETLPEQDLTMAFIRQSIKTSMERMLEYKFIWIDLYHILRVENKIRKHFQQAYEKRLAGSHFLFEQLMDQGKMREAAFDQEYHFLAIRMITYGNTWINTLALYEADKVVDLDEQASILFGMLYPYLTEKGQAEFRRASPTA